jgi:lipoprotein-anchoring transpeptidase ErfK/SrfK
VRIVATLSIFLCAAASIDGETSVEIDLQEQMAYLLRGGRAVLASPIASGRYGHLTPTGSFKVLEKERNHYSSIYGRIVDARGNTIVADADADRRVPPGCKFVPAPMRYFIRFDAANGMHAGFLPGYPASHGCVRLPEENAIAFFNAVDVGTPVTVFGRTPTGRSFQAFGSTIHRPQERYVDPRFDPRWAPPWWWR